MLVRWTWSSDMLRRSIQKNLSSSPLAWTLPTRLCSLHGLRSGQPLPRPSHGSSHIWAVLANIRVTQLYGIVPEANSWEAVKNIYTLGGQVINEERNRGLDILRSIWDLLRCYRGEPLPEDYHKPRNDSSSTRGVLTPSFEIVGGQVIPDVKIYVSPWQFGRNDREIAECTIKIFKRLGWQKGADSYFDLLQEAL